MTSKQSERVLAQLLDECAELMLHGESLAACLARYPEHAAVLAPLLQMVSVVRQGAGVPPRSPVAAASSRAQFVAAAEGLSAAGASAQRSRLAAWWDQLVRGLQVLRPLPAGLVAAMVCVVVVGLLTTGVITASATALPGDPLYRVKLAAEQARLLLARDQQARDALDQQILNNRIGEAEKIRALGRPVDQMPLAGRLDAFGPGEWLISGVPVEVNGRTTIVGTPALGALVRGSVRAPGDGSLIALYLEVTPAEGRPGVIKPAGAPRAAASSTLTPTLRPAQATETPVPTPRPDTGALLMPPDVFPTFTPPRASAAPPARRLPALPTPLGTASLPANPTVAFTDTPVPAPTATAIPDLPPTRPVQKQHLTDAFISNISGNLWTIGGITVEVDGSTQIIGQPGLGDSVDVEMVVRSGRPPLALSITLRIKGPTPQLIEFTGQLQQKDGATWTINGLTVTVLADTVIAADPQVGDWVQCTGERYVDGSIRGRRIEKLSLQVVEFSGLIEVVASGQWRVAGQTILVQPDVLISGALPAAGRLADVRAEQLPDGRLLARVIYVLPDTPTPSRVPTLTPAATSTPVDTNTPVPAASPAPTNTVEPTATTPPPTDTPLSPAATDTPEPLPTDTPLPPTATDTPLPPPTDTVVPGVTEPPPPKSGGRPPKTAGPRESATPATPVAMRVSYKGPA